MAELIFFIVLTIMAVWLIRKESNYILEMGLNGGTTLSLVIIAGVVIVIGWCTSLYYIFEYFNPDPYSCEFCATGK